MDHYPLFHLHNYVSKNSWYRAKELKIIPFPYRWQIAIHIATRLHKNEKWKPNGGMLLGSTRIIDDVIIWDRQKWDSNVVMWHFEFLQLAKIFYQKNKNRYWFDYIQTSLNVAMLIVLEVQVQCASSIFLDSPQMGRFRSLKLNLDSTNSTKPIWMCIIKWMFIH